MEKQRENSQEIINDLLKDYPSLRAYFEEVAYHLSCRVRDLRILDVHPDFEEQDEEGWEIKCFFPEGAKIENHRVLYENYHTSDFSIGEVSKIISEGKTYIVEQNASPLTVYTKVQRNEKCK